jgi:hypothetical protein
VNRGKQGGTGCCATGGLEAQEDLADETEVLIATSVTVWIDSFTSAVQAQSGIVSADTRVNQLPDRTGPRVASNPGYPVTTCRGV